MIVDQHHSLDYCWPTKPDNRLLIIWAKPSSRYLLAIVNRVQKMKKPTNDYLIRVEWPLKAWCIWTIFFFISLWQWKTMQRSRYGQALCGCCCCCYRWFNKWLNAMIDAVCHSEMCVYVHVCAFISPTLTLSRS